MKIKKVSHKKKLIKRKIKSKNIDNKNIMVSARKTKGKKKVEYMILMRQSL